MSPVFDPREVECEPITEVVDEGVYVVQVEKVFPKEDDYGYKLRVFYKIISPDAFKDKFVMENFNLEHAKANVSLFGKQQFKRLLMCVGMADSPLNSYSDLEGKQLKVTVEIEPHYKKQGAQQNKLSDHRPVNAIDVNTMKTKAMDDIPY